MKPAKWFKPDAPWFILLSAVAAIVTILAAIGILSHPSSPATACSGNCTLVTSTLTPNATFTPTPTAILTPSPVPTTPVLTATPTITTIVTVSSMPTASATPIPPPCPDTYHASDYEKILDQAPPANIHPGDQFTLYFVLCNDGSTTWSDAGHYDFQCDDYYHTQTSPDGYVPNCMNGGQYGFGGQSVAPGQTFQFNLKLIAPQQLGKYQTWWDLRGPGGIIPNNNNYIDVYVTGS